MSFYISISLLTVILCLIVQYQNINGEELPTIVYPIQYNISLFTNFDSFNKINETGLLIGNISITVTSLEESDVILLHCADNIAIPNVKVIDNINGADILQKKKFDEDSMLNLYLHRPLITNNTYTIIFTNFTTKYNARDSSGIIVKKYWDNDQEKREYMIVTQMQPESARKVFPCFDTPQYKSFFHMTIETNSKYNILFNTAEMYCYQYRSSNSTWKKCAYKRTPKMSTYNVVFALVLFNCKEKYDKYNRTFRIWARNISISKVEFALEKTIQSLLKLEAEMNIKFPLTKIDSLAIPNFRGFYGMEHYGLITYSEYILALDPRFPMAYSKVLSTETVAHEIAHQWFGNLVTSSAWKDLWLHEGFSNYYGFRVAYDILDLKSYYNYKKIKLIQYMRNMENYYTIKQSFITNDDYEKPKEKFDYYTYSKGYLIVDMIEGIMGKLNLTASLQDYLNKNRFNTVDTSFLYESLLKFSNTNIDQIVNGWLTTAGYPMITVQNSRNGFLIRQNTSLLISSKNNITSNFSWMIPIKILFGNNTFQSDTTVKLITNLTQQIHINNYNKSNHWVIFNHQFSNYMAIDYTQDLMDKLIDQLLVNHTIFSPMNKAQIIINYYDMSKRHNRKNIITFLKLLSFIKNETEPLPISIAIDYIDKLNGLFIFRSFYIKWMDYVNYILISSYNTLLENFSANFSKPTLFPIYARINIYYISCKFRHKSCDIITDVVINRWKSNNLLPSDYDLLHISLCNYVAKDMLGKHWLEVFRDNSFDSWDLLTVKYYALGCSIAPWTVEKNIALIFSIRNDKNFPHVQIKFNKSIVFDYLKGVQPFQKCLLESMSINNPDSFTSIYRLRRYPFGFLYSSLSSEVTFPILQNFMEYLMPTYSHLKLNKYFYRTKHLFMKRIYNYTVSNLKWIFDNVNELERYFKEFEYSD